jgi:hypothetical protein
MTGIVGQNERITSIDSYFEGVDTDIEVKPMVFEPSRNC